MRVLEGELVLLRIFIGESDKWHHQPLATALIERLRREGFAGATVFKAVEGFGARSILHTAAILRLSEDLPVVIEVVETEAQIEKLKPILEEMVADGLVTLEKVHVLRYTPRSPPEVPPSGRLRKALSRPRGKR
jgi:uncharacterized protein